VSVNPYSFAVEVSYHCGAWAIYIVDRQDPDDTELFWIDQRGSWEEACIAAEQVADALRMCFDPFGGPS